MHHGTWGTVATGSELLCVLSGTSIIWPGAVTESAFASSLCSLVTLPSVRVEDKGLLLQSLKILQGKKLETVIVLYDGDVAICAHETEQVAIITFSHVILEAISRYCTMSYSF